MIRSYLLARIDECKKGIIDKEELYEIIENFVSTNTINLTCDPELYSILYHELPDVFLFYIDEPGNPDTKEIEFWKALKEIEDALQ